MFGITEIKLNTINKTAIKHKYFTEFTTKQIKHTERLLFSILSQSDVHRASEHPVVMTKEPYPGYRLDCYKTKYYNNCIKPNQHFTVKMLKVKTVCSVVEKLLKCVSSKKYFSILKANCHRAWIYLMAKQSIT